MPDPFPLLVSALCVAGAGSLARQALKAAPYDPRRARELVFGVVAFVVAGVFALCVATHPPGGAP